MCFCCLCHSLPFVAGLSFCTECTVRCCELWSCLGQATGRTTVLGHLRDVLWLCLALSFGVVSVIVRQRSGKGKGSDRVGCLAKII